MHKLLDLTAALEGHLSTLANEWAPLQHVYYNHSLAIKHAGRLDGMENRMRINIVRAIGIPETEGWKNPVFFIEQWLRAELSNSKVV